MGKIQRGQRQLGWADVSDQDKGSAAAGYGRVIAAGLGTSGLSWRFRILVNLHSTAQHLLRR